MKVSCILRRTPFEVDFGTLCVLPYIWMAASNLLIWNGGGDKSAYIPGKYTVSTKTVVALSFEQHKHAHENDATVH